MYSSFLRKCFQEAGLPLKVTANGSLCTFLEISQDPRTFLFHSSLDGSPDFHFFPHHPSTLLAEECRDGIIQQDLLGSDDTGLFIGRIQPDPTNDEPWKKLLQPTEVAEAIEQGLVVQRIGDWYFIPDVPGSAIPESEDAVHRNEELCSCIGAEPLTVEEHWFDKGRWIELHSGANRYKVLQVENLYVRGSVQVHDTVIFHLSCWHKVVVNRELWRGQFSCGIRQVPAAVPKAGLWSETP